MGREDCAMVWSDHVVKMDPENRFMLCFTIKKKIVSGDFKDAILWCEDTDSKDQRKH
jgi:hypothetical protein